MKSIVIKSGGSVFVDPDSFVHFSEKIRRLQEGYSHIYVVLSAMKGMTDTLVDKVSHAYNADKERLHKALKGELYYPEMDNHEVAGAILQGEIDSTYMLQRYLPDANVLTQDDPSYPIVANSACLNAVVDQEETMRRGKDLGKNGSITLVSGFGGVTTYGAKVTLGRGASDLVAGWLLKATDAEKVVYVKDVPGIYRNWGAGCAAVADVLGLDEAIELCSGGVLDKRVLSVFRGLDKEVIVGHIDNLVELATGAMIGTKILTSYPRCDDGR